MVEYKDPLHEGMAPWDPEQFTKVWQRFVERWEDRDDRMDLMRRVVIGDWDIVDPTDKGIPVRSPNVIHAGLMDTAASAAMVPTVRVGASRPGQRRPEERASVMEQIGASYIDAAGGQVFFHQNSIVAGAYGLCSLLVTCDGENPPKFMYRDPLTCYPESSISTLGVTERCVFASDVYVSQLPHEWQEAWREHCDERDWQKDWFINHAVTLVEYNDCERVTVGLAYNAATIPRNGRAATRGKANFVTVIVEDYANEAGMCFAVIGQLPSVDGEPRGQYDQVVGVMHAHIRMMAVALEYADQAVYNPMFVVDPIGEINDGPDGWIELGPNGKIGRVPPSTTSFSFFEEMNRLIDGVHLGARWPKTRPGDISQSQASGKFVESTVSVQNTVIGSHHEMFQRMMSQAERVAFNLDKKRLERLEEKGIDTAKVSGTLRNKQYSIGVKADDIDLAADVRVEYGLGFGRDVAQSAVLALQLVGGNVISMEDAQENFPGIPDVARTRARILAEMLEKQLGAKILMGVQQGSVSDRALVQMLRKARDGSTLDAIYEEFVIKPQEQQQEGMLTSGLDGSQMMPGGMGGPPGAGGPMPPPPPDAQGLLAGMLGKGGAGPAGPETISRLSVPLGDGGFAGSQVTGGG